MSIKLSGIYRVADTEQLSRDYAAQTVPCVVYFLDDTKETFRVDYKAKGQVLLDLVFDCLELLERDYFGLQYVTLSSEPEGVVSINKWLDPTKIIRKEVKDGPPYSFYFRVKFYIQDPTQLQEEYTRYHFFLQLKKDMLEGRLMLPLETATVLASYSVQSELGDYNPEDHRVGYISEFRFIPNQTATFEMDVAAMHQKRRGLTPANAEFDFLTLARRLDHYGVIIHNATDTNKVPIQLGVGAVGLNVFKEMRKIRVFLWANIIKISFKKKVFYVETKKGEISSNNNNNHSNGSVDTMSGASLQYTLLSANLAKALWWNCIEYHTFFRMRTPQPLASAGSGNGNGTSGGGLSRFFSVRPQSQVPVFSGRTLHQVVEAKKKGKTVDRGFVRIPSRRFARRTVASYGSMSLPASGANTPINRLSSSAVSTPIGRPPPLSTPTSRHNTLISSTANNTGGSVAMSPQYSQKSFGSLKDSTALAGWESTGTTRSLVRATLAEVDEDDTSSDDNKDEEEEEDDGGFKTYRTRTLLSSNPGLATTTSIRRLANPHMALKTSNSTPSTPHSTEGLISGTRKLLLRGNSTDSAASTNSYSTIPTRKPTVQPPPKPAPPTENSTARSRFGLASSTSTNDTSFSDQVTLPRSSARSSDASMHPALASRSSDASMHPVPAARRNPSSGTVSGALSPMSSIESSHSRTTPDVDMSSPLSGDGLVTIRIRPDDRGRFGFNVKGGLDQSLPIIVSRVGVNMPADVCIPPLHEGDQVLLINGRDISSHTHEQVVQFIRSAADKHSGELVLVVRPSMYMADDSTTDPSHTLQNLQNGSLSPSSPALLPPTSPTVPQSGSTGNLLKDSVLALQESLQSGLALAQFDQLYRRTPGLTMDIARQSQNAGKNRYRDISPYDVSRVVLKDSESGDYINASYINMEISQSGIVNRYIATQGPLPHTCSDFWQMCWEQQTALVVMLTASSERGRVKCHQYWPNLYETTEFGDIQLTCLREESSACCSHRELMLYKTGSREERRVAHIQYTSWPDHGTPSDVAEFNQLVHKVRQRRAGHVEPIVVHCSAGIGRTGVLIVMETAMCLIEANQPVYPLEMVRQMRDQRAMCIQTAVQYQFVCESIISAYEDESVKPLPEFAS